MDHDGAGHGRRSTAHVRAIARMEAHVVELALAAREQAVACTWAGGGAGAVSWQWHWRGELAAGDGGCGDSRQLGHSGCGAR